jgi:hypothetical protein
MVSCRRLESNNPAEKFLANMRQALAPKIQPASSASAGGLEDKEPLLTVAIIYQDSLTCQWAKELWDRVAQFTENKGVICKSWSISDLAQEADLVQAVQVAANADVVVVSVRDTGDLPLFLHVWIDAWMPRRTGREGALVALIGVPAQPDAQIGCTHQYLKTVAGRAGLDYLPRERSLPAARLPTGGKADR